jgi:ATP-dependent RNA helicase SUPV3L1/SUV3
LAPLAKLSALHGDVSPPARGLIVQLVAALGVLSREAVAEQLVGLTRSDRQALARCGVRLGPLHLFMGQLLRPEPTRWRLALWAVANDLAQLPPLPAPGRVSMAAPPADAQVLAVAGYWRVGSSGNGAADAIAVRIDMVDRLARHIHERRDGRMPFMPDPNWAASLGLSQDGLARLLRALGYRPRLVDGAPHFAWAGRRRPPQPPADAVPLARGNDASPFAVLAGMKGR